MPQRSYKLTLEHKRCLHACKNVNLIESSQTQIPEFNLVKTHQNILLIEKNELIVPVNAYIYARTENNKNIYIIAISSNFANGPLNHDKNTIESFLTSIGFELSYVQQNSDKLCKIINKLIHDLLNKPSFSRDNHAGNTIYLTGHGPFASLLTLVALESVASCRIVSVTFNSPGIYLYETNNVTSDRLNTIRKNKLNAFNYLTLASYGNTRWSHEYTNNYHIIPSSYTYSTLFKAHVMKSIVYDGLRLLNLYCIGRIPYTLLKETVAIVGPQQGLYGASFFTAFTEASGRALLRILRPENLYVNGSVNFRIWQVAGINLKLFSAGAAACYISSPHYNDNQLITYGLNYISVESKVKEISSWISAETMDGVEVNNNNTFSEFIKKSYHTVTEFGANLLWNNLPAQSDRPSLRTLLDEEGMYEKQLDTLLSKRRKIG